MIYAYCDEERFESCLITQENKNLLQHVTWIDIHKPTADDEKFIQEELHITIPTRAEMAEIELSNRLYQENEDLYMTAVIVAQSKKIDNKLAPITCILSDQHLITIRHSEPHFFKFFESQITKRQVHLHNGPSLFTALLEANVNALADLLEVIGHRLEEYSKEVFYYKANNSNHPDYRTIMQMTGKQGDLNTKVRESLVTLNRMLQFFKKNQKGQNEQDRLEILEKDMTSLSDYATFISNKVTFILEATLGMVYIDQNNIIKIFSVAAVIFLPPTLIASIYGMNFKLMPELLWEYGYIFALVLMVLSSLFAYQFFKWKRWL